MQIPRVKVALVWYTHACMIYTRRCNAPPICTDCFFLSLRPIVAANQQSWISRFTSHLQRIAVPVAAAHAQCRAFGAKSASGAVVRVMAPGGPKFLAKRIRPWWRPMGRTTIFNTGSRGSDVVNDIAQRQQILMSSGWPNSTRPAPADGHGDRDRRCGVQRRRRSRQGHDYECAGSRFVRSSLEILRRSRDRPQQDSGEDPASNNTVRVALGRKKQSEWTR